LEKAKPWWNAEIQHTLKNTRDWKTKAKQELYDINSISSDTKSANNKAIKNLRNKIKMEKRKWIQKTLEEADTNNIWAFRKWSKGARRYPTPPISRGPNRMKAIYAADKADTIHQELFQPPPDLPNTTTPNLNHENPNDLPCHPITKEEVHKAIFLPRKSKALGLS
jgi:hypothetical protein